MVGERGCLWPDNIKTLLLFSVIFMILMATVLEPICKIVNDPGLTLIIIASTSMILTSLVRWVLKI